MRYADTVLDWEEKLGLPPEAASGAVKVTVTGRKHATVEHHRGLLGYSPELIEVHGGAVRVRILGSDLLLRAMDRETLVVTGSIAAVEYV